jgi:hypothetical protein
MQVGWKSCIKQRRNITRSQVGMPGHVTIHTTGDDGFGTRSMAHRS